MRYVPATGPAQPTYRMNSTSHIVRDVVRESVANIAMGIPPVRDWRLQRPRAGQHFHRTKEQLDRYAFDAVKGVEQVAGRVDGQEVMEFGPGDTLSSGLAFLAAGAASYTAVDRFVPDYSSAEAKRWYTGVREGWAASFPDRAWPSHLDPTRFPEDYPDIVRNLNGSVEQMQSQRRFDIVTSWQVGEHVIDIDAFAARTASLLKPDGVAVHRVDFGPHDCWLRYEDPLVFLRFPAPVWALMGSNRGSPNRFRHHEFMAAWKAAGLAVECTRSRRYEPSDIDFERLNTRFQAMPRESLLVRDVIYVCRHA